MKKLTHACLFFVATLLASSCAVGPDYHKPEVPLPTAFKEGDGWKFSQPRDAIPHGEWWQIFCDSELNALEKQININNQNIALAEANFRQAQALVSQARSGFFPTVSISGSQSREQNSSHRSPANSYIASATSSWEPDLWGKIRRSLENSHANADASAADLEAVRLSAQAELAVNYLSLRVADEQKRYLSKTVEAYQKSLALTENLYRSGVQTRSDYLQAKVQLESAQAQEIDVDIQRAAYEHAIAVLIGKAPADFSLSPALTIPDAPFPPPSLPSQVLERRPDVAAAERRMQAANAKIGIAEAAFFPDFTLSASSSYVSSAMAGWFVPASRVWSIGPSIAESIFDAGLRQAQTKEAIAAYDASVATYRQTVLAAFQEVEDNLASLNALGKEQTIRDATVEDAKTSNEVITNQYKEGISSYLNVVTAQTTELTNALAALNVRKQRLLSAVALTKALGGSW